MDGARLDESTLCGGACPRPIFAARSSAAPICAVHSSMEANLSGANLRGTNSDPLDAKINQAAVTTKLLGANLEGADLSGSNLSFTQICARPGSQARSCFAQISVTRYCNWPIFAGLTLAPPI